MEPHAYWSNLKHKLKPHKEGAVNIVAFDNSGDYLFSGGQDKRIILLNSNSGKVITSYEGHGREVLDICVDPFNKRFASCGGDRSVCLWDIEKGEIPRKYGGHTQRINTVCMNQEGSLLFSGSYDTSVKIYDIKSYNKHAIQTLGEAKDSISSVFVNNFQIVTGSVDGFVRTYDIRTGKLVSDFISEPITCVTETLDSNCQLISSLDNKIRLLDKQDGTLLNTFQGHKNRDYRLQACLDNEDQFVISGSEDGLIYIWEITEDKPRTKLNFHSNMVGSVCISNDNSKLASASVSGDIVISM